MCGSHAADVGWGDAALPWRSDAAVFAGNRGLLGGSL